MQRYIQTNKTNVVIRPLMNGVWGLTYEIRQRMARWEITIREGLGSEALAEQFDWVKRWVDSEAQGTIDGLGLQALLHSNATFREMDRKADLLLDVFDALESVEEVAEKYESLLDWVLEIPGKLKDVLADAEVPHSSQPSLTEYEQLVAIETLENSTAVAA